MKPLLRVLLASLAGFSLVAAQSEAADPAEAVNNSTRTFVPDALQAPVFTPPVPVESKRLPDIRIDATITVPSESATTLTLQRGAASTLPDLPPPPPPEAAKSPPEPTVEDRANLAYERRHNLMLGATVYDHKVSQVQWTDQETGTSYQALCGFDIGLLAGIGSFVRDGEAYSIFLMHSDFDTTGIRRSNGNTFPGIPEVAPGQILVTQGELKNPSATASLYFIKELIDSEKERLTAYQSAREKYQREAAAWAAAHPRKPENQTIIFRPHRGSRYLADPQPEMKGEPAR